MIYKEFVSTTGGVFNTINLYLLDSVTGHMVFHCSHKRAKGPVTVVHSENWVVVSTVPPSGIVLSVLQALQSSLFCVALFYGILMLIVYNIALILWQRNILFA